MDGRQSDGKRRTLSGWQEIADYVDKAVSTVQRWERTLGLPVRRLAAGEAGRKGAGVFAFADEIDEWLRINGAQANVGDVACSVGLADAPPRGVPGRRVSALKVIAAVVMVVGVAAGVSRFWQGVKRPSRLMVSWETRSLLVARDADGEVVWTRSEELPVRGLTDSAHQPTSVEAVDLDGDGVDEYVVLITPQIDRGVRDHLVALDGAGRELWRFEAGESLTIDGTTFDDNFMLLMFRVVRDAGPAIVIGANHRLHFPSLVSILDADGVERATYAHAGWLTDLLAVELDGVGEKLIAFGAGNNILEAPVIGVLPLQDSYRGGSPGPGSWGSDLADDVEVAYLRLPRTRLSQQLHTTRSHVERLTPSTDPQSIFSATVASEYGSPYDDKELHEYILRFDRSLNVLTAAFTDAFRTYLDGGRSVGWHTLTMADEIPLGDYQVLRAGPQLADRLAQH